MRHYGTVLTQHSGAVVCSAIVLASILFHIDLLHNQYLVFETSQHMLKPNDHEDFGGLWSIKQ